MWGREPINSLTHFVGAILASMGLAWMVSLAWDDLSKLITTAIFGISMILLYSASTAMHWYDGSERITRLLQKLDHAAICLLIAGTYTPLAYFLLDGLWRWGMLGLIWSLAAVGVFSKLFFFWQGHLSTLFYMAMGWTVIIVTPKLLPLLPLGLLGLIVAGGVAYSIGAVIYSLKMPNFHRHFGHHEIWHLCVLGGNSFHFLAVLLYVLR
jgi:hemolysin III